MPEFNGMTLIEILISLFILSVALLGLDAMTLDAMNYLRRAYYFNVANEQIYSMVERLHAHSVNEYPQQIKIWNQENRAVLPAGKGYVIEKLPVYQVTLFWGEKTQQKHCEQIVSKTLNCLSVEAMP